MTERAWEYGSREVAAECERDAREFEEATTTTEDEEMNTDNAYSPYEADFEFGGAGDTGVMHDDTDDFECECVKCGEPCCRKAMSKHTPDACRYCCPVHAAEYEAERAADLAWEANN